jgi:hypothetical protein
MPYNAAQLKKTTAPYRELLFKLQQTGKNMPKSYELLYPQMGNSCRLFACVRVDFISVRESFGSTAKRLRGDLERCRALAETSRILWCHSPSEQSQFDPIWESLEVSSKSKQSEKLPPAEPKFETRQSVWRNPINPRYHPLPKSCNEINLNRNWHLYPFRHPLRHWKMRILRHYRHTTPFLGRQWSIAGDTCAAPVADGPVDVLDEDATVKQANSARVFIWLQSTAGENRSCPSIAVGGSKWLNDSISSLQPRLGGKPLVLKVLCNLSRSMCSIFTMYLLPRLQRPLSNRTYCS